MEPLYERWEHYSDIGPKSYICGYCGQITGVSYGYFTDQRSHFIYFCGGCKRPSFFEYGELQTPGFIPGNEVSHLPKEIESLYNEARYCIQVNSYTACVLICRKILMHISVEKGAEPNQSFISYVEYLAGKGFVTPDSKAWVDYIRTKSNEANHEIVLMTSDDALQLLSFVEMLLKLIFEFPARIMPTSDSKRKK